LPTTRWQGNDHAQRVPGNRGADILGQRPVAQLAGKLTVTGGLTVWDPADQIPDPLLELITPRIHRKMERVSVPGEVLVQLPGDLTETGIGTDTEIRRVWPVPVVTEVDAGQVAIVGDQRQVSDRRTGNSMRDNHERPFGTWPARPPGRFPRPR